jgi:hypothetical protein
VLFRLGAVVDVYAIVCCVRGEMKKLHIERIAASHASGLFTGLPGVSVYFVTKKGLKCVVPTGARKIRDEIAT